MSAVTYGQFSTATHPHHIRAHISPPDFRDSLDSENSENSAEWTTQLATIQTSLTTPSFTRPMSFSSEDYVQRDNGRADSEPPRSRMERREWDTAKVPPSKFQRPQGSMWTAPTIWSAPPEREGSVLWNKIKAVAEKLKNKGKK